ncbi:S1 family peptidase [Crossiella sp. CA198]|uniref:S1 family peptidase n=1 Tax=Crossiella sp. CA198 TaxID=3455607 RepID=UPI003F8D33B8
MVLTKLLSAAAIIPFLVGGTPADQDYPFMASLQTSYGAHFCGGSLIKPDWLVTAAHCVKDEQPGQLRVRIGSRDAGSGGTLTGVRRIIAHPRWGPTAYYDIAVVQLDRAVGQRPIPIAADVPVGSATRLLGWGQTCARPGCGGTPKVLQQLDTSVVEARRCLGIDKSELCVNNPGGNSGACYGDSGGPQLRSIGGAWQLVGAASRAGSTSTTCATAPSVYTAVPAYRDWIAQQTGG